MLVPPLAERIQSFRLHGNLSIKNIVSSCHHYHYSAHYIPVSHQWPTISIVSLVTLTGNCLIEQTAVPSRMSGKIWIIEAWRNACNFRSSTTKMDPLSILNSKTQISGQQVFSWAHFHLKEKNGEGARGFMIADHFRRRFIWKHHRPSVQSTKRLQDDQPRAALCITFITAPDCGMLKRNNSNFIADPKRRILIVITACRYYNERLLETNHLTIM